MRLMYDSDEPNSIPTNAQMVAGYIDGSTYRWPESAWNRFPNSVKVRIARRVSTNDGHVLDVEEGIPTVWPPTKAIVDWVVMRRRAGVEPTIYCNQLNDWSDIRKLFTDAGVAQPQYWVARYNNVRDIPAGAVAKQFANPPLAGGHYDLSVVADYWPGVDGVGVEDMPLNEDDLKKIRRAVWGTTHDPDGGHYEGLNFVFSDAAARVPEGGYADQIRTALRSILTGIATSLSETDRNVIVQEVTQNVISYLQENPPQFNVTVDEQKIAQAVWALARDDDPATGPRS